MYRNKNQQKQIEIEENMFYSPKKDIERYVTFKNQEIKTLKQQLQEQKITEDNFLIAKKKLQKVQNQRDILLAEDHHQLIETLQKAVNKKKSLEQDLSLKRMQLDLKSSQRIQLMSMRRQLQEKIQKARELLNIQKTKKTQLSTKRKTVDESVRKLISENQLARREIQQTNLLLNQAQKQLGESKMKAVKTSQRVLSLKQQMATVGSEILAQKQQISHLKTQDKLQQLTLQNLQIKLQYLIQIKANLLASKDKILVNKLLLKERTELNRHQNISSEIISSLVKISDAMYQNKLVEKQSCERQIKEKLIELELSECTQSQLKDQLDKIQDKIIKVDQNINSIVSSLEGMDVQDSNLIAIITGLPTLKKDPRQSRVSFENKQNLNYVQFPLKKSVWSKIGPNEMARTWDQSQSTTI